MNDWYVQALVAEADGTLQTWAVEFLRASGNNTKLAETIETKGELYLGLIDYALRDLRSEVGVGAGFKWPEEESIYNQRIDAMVESLKNGWKPTPLIATNFWEDYFEVSDGAHRHAALIKAGIDTYPTLFFFKDAKSMKQFTNNLVNHAQITKNKTLKSSTRLLCARHNLQKSDHIS